MDDLANNNSELFLAHHGLDRRGQTYFSSNKLYLIKALNVIQPNPGVLSGGQKARRAMVNYIFVDANAKRNKRFAATPLQHILRSVYVQPDIK